MAQTASTDDRKVTDGVKAVGNRVADNTRAVADKGRDMAHDVEDATVAMVDQTAAKSAAAVDRFSNQFSRVATASPAVVNDVASVWRDLVSAQLADNVDAFRRLAAARNWQESLEVQGGYISGNITRMGDVATRCAELTGKMMKSMLTTDRRPAR